MKYGSERLYPWDGTVGILSALEVIDNQAAAVNIFGLDRDKDFLSSDEETLIGTDPNNWDSDYDRMSDAWEHAFDSVVDPLSDDADEDPDGDGYVNIIECYLGSQPDDPSSPAMGEPDTDKDGMPDSWETNYGLNPNSADDAMEDFDHDWYCNLLEYAIGGNPTDPANHGIHPNEENGGVRYETYP